jgi:hypothetical protein
MQRHDEMKRPLEIRVDGIFDVPAAEQVVRQIVESPAQRAVRVDLTHVREFHDFAVAVLGQELARHPERIVVTGWRLHQLRLLTYLGYVEAGAGADMASA